VSSPYALSEGFEWCEFDVNDGAQLEEVYQLLTLHYVEDEDNMFRFDYSKSFLNWALKAPGWRRDWHLGVRVSTTKKLVGIITAIPCETRVYDKTFLAVEINFLCVHKKLRKHRLAPVLIREITRRVNVTGRFQATYTAGLMLPKPVSSARYWHRSLNPKKLIECKFSALQPRMTMAMTLKLLRVENETTLPGLRAMEERDVDAVLELLTAYLAKFNLANTWTRDEVAHWLLPRADVVWSYVVEDAAKNTISDFLSFYNLPSTVIGHEKHKQIKAAYTFYTVANKYTIQQLIADALVLAKRNQFDVFNSLDLLEYASVLKDLKFGPGDGHLQYYLYNWRTKPMPANQVGLVLL
jgi:glycylpeptide N-tetradecanoyltransferase